MNRRFLRTFDLSAFGCASVVMGALLLALAGSALFTALGASPLGGALIVGCGGLLALTVVDRARWGERRSQHLVTFGDRPATEAELRDICAALGRRGIAAEVERDEQGRPVLGYRNADQRGIVPALVSQGASAPRSGW